ncbi:hypothetical protein V8F33_013721 [Rhypophila sp. PSN 637]
MAPKRGKQPPRGSRVANFRAAAGLSNARDFSSSNLSTVFAQGFTMRDEARNTASHQVSWGQDARLRQKPVSFISAGFTEPLQNLKPVEEPGEGTGDNLAIGQGIDVGEPSPGQTTEPRTLEVDLSETIVKVTIGQGPPMESPGVPQDTKAAVNVDTVASSNTCVTAPPSPPGFFFDLEGDKSLRPTSPIDAVPVRVSSPAPSDSSDEIILFKGRLGHAKHGDRHLQNQVQPPSRPISKAHEELNAQTNPMPRSAITTPTTQPRQKRTKPEKSYSGFVPLSNKEEDVEEDEEDAILADYIANMAAQEDEDTMFNSDGIFGNRRDLGGDHDAFDFGLEDDDNGIVAERSGGYDSEEESSSENDNDEAMGDDISDNEMASALDDESLARLLAKQDELGMGTDKLLLRVDSFNTSKPLPRGQRSSRIPPANVSSVADGLDGLDLTDWNQPNISRARRTKQPPTFNVSDSELEMALRTSWQTDRERKKKRKLERELLRSEGLLGKNIDPEDLRVKYQSHMVLDEVKVEFVSFLLGSAETIQFPPMENNARKIVHELANRFNIKSKSTGKGDQRRPVLYRTKRTARYNQSSAGEAMNHVEMASVKIRRKFFYRPDNKGQAVPKMSAGKRSGHKAVTYQEGEIVGASAPQLGQDNKGHAMLEKMGWSRGMALGTLENKGILEPVSQVVKRSKAGLG